MFKRYIIKKNFLIPSMVLIFLLSGYAFTFAGDKDVFNNNSDFHLDSSLLIQSNTDESATISKASSLKPQSHGVNLRSAHKYIGYATAALAGITAATFSSQDLHEIAGFTTAGLSLITTALGFYEYGEFLNLHEGFTGYNVHMILETAATIGFVATAALRNDKSAHSVIGGVSTAMMIIPIFVVHW